MHAGSVNCHSTRYVHTPRTGGDETTNPWLTPGIPPTHRRVEVPMVAIVHFRNGKLAHEHIYWDQASVLKQIGLLNSPALPVAGVESARKVLDPKFEPT